MELDIVAESDQLPRVASWDGVSVAFLDHMVDMARSLNFPLRVPSTGRELHGHKEMTCEEVSELLVLPFTCEAGPEGESCSYSEVLKAKRMRFDDRPAAGKANVMVCYSREYKFLEFVESLQGLRGKLLWIDMFVEDQTELAEEPVDAEWIASFERTVHGMGNVVAVMDRWSGARLWTRLWPLFEISIAAKHALTFDVAWLPHFAVTLSTALTEEFTDMVESVRVDFELAGCRTEDEYRLLRDTIEGSDGGIIACSTQCQVMLHDWLADAGRKQLREIPADRRSTSKLANEVAVLLKELGRLGEALPLMRQCLAGAKIKYGAQERQTLACMHNLGELHHLRWLCKDGDGLQELQNALPLLTEALAGRRKLLGQHDLDTLQTLDMLALVYQDSNNLVLAEQHATEAVAGFRSVLGDGHPYLLTAVQNLGLILRESGNLEGALPLHIEARRGKEECYGPEGKETIDSLSALGWLYLKRGEDEKAAEALRLAVARNKAVRGEHHPHTLMDVARLQKVLSTLKAVAGTAGLATSALGLAPSAHVC